MKQGSLKEVTENKCVVLYLAKKESVIRMKNKNDHVVHERYKCYLKIRMKTGLGTGSTDGNEGGTNQTFK